MPLSGLQHILVQTADLEATKDWYVRVLGLEVGPHPDFKFPVYWLYLDGKDVLHLTSGGKTVSENRKAYLGQQSDATYGSGVVDHVAFRATGLAEVIAHLEAEGIEFTRRQASNEASFQLFLIDPNGLKVELNFPVEEAEGIAADVTAADLRPTES